jgi:hypothetical protein
MISRTSRTRPKKIHWAEALTTKFTKILLTAVTPLHFMAKFRTRHLGTVSALSKDMTLLASQDVTIIALLKSLAFFLKTEGFVTKSTRKKRNAKRLGHHLP